MRYLTILIMLAAFGVDVEAQEEALPDKDEGGRGFGALVTKLTSVRSQSAVMIGARGGWIIDHSLVLGGGAYAVETDVNAPAGVLPLEGPLDIEFGCIGFEVEYLHHPEDFAHLSLYSFIGAGITNYVKDAGPAYKSTEQVGETGFMFVWEPAVNAELNVTNWAHVGLGISYRFVTGVKHEGLNNSDFNGMTATLTFKFGKF